MLLKKSLKPRKKQGVASWRTEMIKFKDNNWKTQSLCDCSTRQSCLALVWLVLQSDTALFLWTYRLCIERYQKTKKKGFLHHISTVLKTNRELLFDALLSWSEVVLELAAKINWPEWYHGISFGSQDEIHDNYWVPCLPCWILKCTIYSPKGLQTIAA